MYEKLRVFVLVKNNLFIAIYLSIERVCFEGHYCRIISQEWNVSSFSFSKLKTNSQISHYSNGQKKMSEIYVTAYHIHNLFKIMFCMLFKNISII